MSIEVKRKRGRPRRDEPTEINDFDLTLIQEFQRRPAFYDRAHPQYRNREYLEPQWQEIAANLGYTVSLIKDRMMQLRNRYNLEKRRVEALQEQYGDPEITSQWSLYDSLTFLCDHIKSRNKPSLLPKEQPASTSSDGEDYKETPPIKRQRKTANAVERIQPATNHVMHNHSNQRRNAALSSLVTGASAMPTTTTTAPTAATKPVNSNNNIGARQACVVDTLPANGGIDKFQAFGQFISSSLIELHEQDALRLVEKFTSELVNSLLAKQKSKQF